MSEQLTKRVAEHGAGDGRGRRRRRSESRSRSPIRRRRQRRRETSSESETGMGFREARGAQSGNPTSRTAERTPGHLLQSCLSRMQHYLGRRQGTRELTEVSSVFTPYLSSVLMPTLGEGATLRNSHELANLAAALDLLMEGDVARACDILAQRFRAVELASQDGSWNVARHVQIVGDTRVSSLTQKEREAAMPKEKHELKYRVVGARGHSEMGRGSEGRRCGASPAVWRGISPRPARSRREDTGAQRCPA